LHSGLDSKSLTIYISPFFAYRVKIYWWVFAI
jgi:hypothetical protein